MKRFSILIVLVAFSLFPRLTHGQHLHAFIVVDSDDKKIGKSVAIDGLNVGLLLESGLDENAYTTHKLSGGQVTANGVVQLIRKANIRPQDSVLFYFSGHGLFDRNSGEHYLAMQNRNRIARSKVKETIQSYNPKLAVLISDCCANIVSLPIEQGMGPPPGIASMAGGEKLASYPVLQELFFNTQGLVDLTSSRPGQVSIGERDGGLFTNAFLGTIEENRNASMTWSELFTQSRARTSNSYEAVNRDYTARYNKGVVAKQSTQTAWTFETMYGINPNDQRLGILIDHNNPGVLTQVNHGSVAQRAGLETGDRILSINGSSFSTTTEAIQMVGNSKRDLELVVRCVRTGKAFKHSLRLPY